MRDIIDMFFTCFCFIQTENGPGRCLKNFLEAVRFILTEYGTVASHGDPIHYHSYRFRTHVLCPQLPRSRPPRKKENKKVWPLAARLVTKTRVLRVGPGPVFFGGERGWAPSIRQTYESDWPPALLCQPGCTELQPNVIRNLNWNAIGITLVLGPNR